MEFNVKTFAQLLILNHKVALIFDDISGRRFNIDSYQLMEHPEIAEPNLVEAMNQAYNEAINKDTFKVLYTDLFNAPNEELFWDLLKKKNDARRKIV
jgi:hypothetical protein